MYDLFQELNEAEADLVVDSISLITILIAGADGVIDQEEKTWGAKLTKIRSYAHPESLNELYLRVGEDYTERLERHIAELPDDVEARAAVISEKLVGLNRILAKLDPDIAYKLYESLTSFAKHVAKSSGGFLRIGAISREEKKWIGLPMLTPVEDPEKDEEEV